MQENRTLWISAKTLLFAIRAKDTVVLEHNTNLPSTNFLGDDTQCTVLENNAVDELENAVNPNPPIVFANDTVDGEANELESAVDSGHFV